MENKRSSMILNIILTVCSALLAVSCAVGLINMPPVKAAYLTDDTEVDDTIDTEIDESIFPYYFSFSSEDYYYSSETTYYRHTYDIMYYSKYPVCVVYDQEANSIYSKVYNSETQKMGAVTKVSDYVIIVDCNHLVYDKNDKLIQSQMWVTNDFFVSGFSPYHNGQYIKWSCNVYVFGSDDDAIAFFRDGDESGVIREPEQEDNTIDLNTLYLTDVKLNTHIAGYYSVTWSGTSLDDELLDVPDSDTLIVISMVEYDLDTLKVTAIPYYQDLTYRFSNHKLSIDFLEYLDYALLDESKLTLTQVYFTPCYTKDDKLYIGRTTVVNLSTGKIAQQFIDDEGDFEEIDVTPKEDDPSDFSFSFTDVSDYTSKFFSFLKSLVNAMGSFPTLFSQVLSFLPSIYVNAIGVIFIMILILRILGR